MQRFDAVERPGGVTIDHKARRCWDLHHVWEDGHTYNGVSHSSIVFCSLTAPPPEGKTVKVRAYVPGEADENIDLGWDPVQVQAKVGGRVTFVALDDADLIVWHELTAGKA